MPFQNDDFNLDIRYWLYKILNYWWLFLLFLATAIGGAYAYLRYTPNLFESKNTILIKRTETGGGGISEESVIFAQDFGFTGGNKSVKNEIEILRSLTLMKRVVDKLRLHVEILQVGSFLNEELYKNPPFQPDTFSLAPGVRSAFFQIEVIDTTRFLIGPANSDAPLTERFFDVPFRNEKGYFLIRRSPGMLPSAEAEKNKFLLNIHFPEDVALRYQGGLAIGQIGEWSSILELSLTDAVPAKAEDVLNTLVEVYNEEEVNDENKVLGNTIKFIDERLQRLTDELDIVESGIELYQRQNEIVTNGAGDLAAMVVGQLNQLEQELSGMEVNQQVLASLENYLIEDNNAYELIPANLIAESPSLSAFVAQYNELVLDYDRVTTLLTAQNPQRIQLENRIAEIRRSILLTLQNLRKDMRIPMDRLVQQIAELRGEIRAVPRKKKDLVQIERQQKIKENLYLYLLQRREETALSAAITTPGTRVIDPARSSTVPISPKRQQIYLFAVALGLLLPLSIVVLGDWVNDKVETEDDLKNETSIPLLGRIGKSKTYDEILVQEGSRSAVPEMFRLLRTNLQYLNPNKGQQTILITSSQGGEGKTFITANLGATIALSRKKVILVGMDLRKPRLWKYVGGQEHQSGVTNYLIGEADMGALIQQSPDFPGLHFLPSGPIPPNPSELLLSERMESLFAYLRAHYDYVLIDSPPIGLVADALIINEFTDISLYVVRHKFTRIGMIRMLQNLYAEEKIKNPGIILNGLRNGYGYYGYGYGSGYYSK
jgi:capsular exopolysaccharide synthesis family protein